MFGRRPYVLPTRFTPKQFERIVASYLRGMGESCTGLPQPLDVRHREPIRTAYGAFEMDVTVRFRAVGLDFLMLVECKHHSAPLKREAVQVLHDKLRAVGAHKAVVFCTSGFQRGAIEYASLHGIALVHCRPGKPPETIISGEGADDADEQAPFVGEWNEWVLYWRGMTVPAMHFLAAEALTAL